MIPKTPHAISELSDLLREYRRERFILSATDMEKSKNRIQELDILIPDMDKAISILRQYVN